MEHLQDPIQDLKNLSAILPYVLTKTASEEVKQFRNSLSVAIFELENMKKEKETCNTAQK